MLIAYSNLKVSCSKSTTHEGFFRGLDNAFHGNISILPAYWKNELIYFILRKMLNCYDGAKY